LALAAVDRLHVQGMAEHKSDLLLGTQVGEPVPTEQALNGDNQPVAEGRDRSQERRDGRFLYDLGRALVLRRGTLGLLLNLGDENIGHVTKSTCSLSQRC